MPPAAIDPIANLLRHALGVEVDQTPSRNSGPIVDEVRAPAQLRPASDRGGPPDRDVDRAGNVLFQSPKSNRLIRGAVFDDLRKVVCRSRK